MRKNFIALCTTLSLSAMADNQPLEGFLYQNADAPTGMEWQSPEQLSLNKQQPTAYMFHFADEESALAVLPQNSSYYQTLDGTWKFRWVPSPEKRDSSFQKADFDASGWDDIQVPGCWNVQGLQKDGTMKYGVPLYVNQPVMFEHKVAVGDWKKGVMREPRDQRFTTYKYRNEVGSYRRTFTVPASWQGRRILVNFDGVDSFFYLWINGHYVGFSKNSRNTASFDITPYVNLKGENSIAVEVYRNSDASFLEAQDMFRLPGIIRSTYLTSTPEMKIEDLTVRTSSINDGSATMLIDLTARNLGKKKNACKYKFSAHPVKLYSDEIAKEGTKATFTTVATKETSIHLELPVHDAKLWSAEAPNRYVLVAEIQDKKGKVIDCVSTYFGICKVEIKDTPANEDEFGLKGRYFYVNNKPVKLKGVNRHETSLDRGHAITHEQMEKEVFLMKRGNINHIRTSHYSDDPYMYYLCDKYGIYLEDECNLESHEYYYGDASLSHPAEWKAAHIARNMEMVHAHVNHPSIVIWSLGNEAGPGDNFKAAYAAIKAFDKSRPVQYERNNDIVDIGSNQYPSVGWVQGAVKGNYDIKYPYHISEYAHSMGNSLGNLQDYWTAIESTNFFCGGAIWDWVDQAIDTYTKDGTKYMGYGGDHGDWPNDGMFCMNGIMLPDLTPKPQYYEVKKVYQNVGVTLEEVKDMAKGEHKMKQVKIRVFNKNYFEPIKHDTYNVSVIPVVNGNPQKAIELELGKIIAPRQAQTFTIMLPEKMFENELFLNVEFQLAKQMPWAHAGYVQMAEQLSLDTYAEKQPIFNNGRALLKVVQGGSATTVQGINFVANFEDSDGSLNSLQYDDKYIIESGNGPKLDAFRAPVDNDNWAWNLWFQNGLYDLKHKATAAPVVINNLDGSISIIYNVISQASHQGRAIHRPGKAGEPIEKIEQGREMTADDFHFNSTIRYTIYSDGSIAVASSIVSSDAALNLPRLGYAMKLPKQYDQYEYYGRGPLNNYADRKTGSFIGLYKSTVKEQFVNFAKPQSMGNREDVRWCALTDKAGNGALFIADGEGATMSTSALPWSALQMTLASHPHELPESDGIYLHLDCQVTGLGGNSCGQGGPLEYDCVKGALHQFKYIIRPVSPSTQVGEDALVRTDNRYPVTIVRDRAGKVTVIGEDRPRILTEEATPILYTITTTAKKGKKAPQALVYDGRPIDMHNGGTISAWYQGEEQVKATVTFERIENIPLEVSYVSSEEGPDGDVAANLVDGDPSTIWHTMYSITVPKYPHWIDFDCGEEKMIKGFAYLPRQDGGSNGNIKGYKVELSLDGKNWSKPVAQGEFENNLKEKKVTLKEPQKARYLRFTAVSSQNGSDFASGAEFTVSAE